MSIYCNKKCCHLQYVDYYCNHNNKYKKNCKKAGVILHDITNNSILLIQSRGNLWGFPKGSSENNENFRDCAIRELFEETGISIKYNQLHVYYYVNTNVKYFYIKYNQFNINIKDHTDSNDATGIGWIKIDCLQTLVQNNTIKLNFHAKKCIKFFFNINL